MTGKPNYNDGLWHGWNGGECPVHPKTVVDAVWHDPLRSTAGLFVAREASQENSPRIAWSHVVKFRVIREHREPKVWWRVGKHLHETEDDAQEFLNDLALNYPTMDFGPIVKVVEVEE